MAITPISPLPTPPSRSDDPNGFSAKADALLGALPTFVGETNALASSLELLSNETLEDMEQLKEAAEISLGGIADAAVGTMNGIKNAASIEVSGLRDEAEGARDTAVAARDVTLGARDVAVQASDDAAMYRTQAQSAAAAAGSAAGLPSLVGNGLRVLRVTLGETGVEWGAASVRLPIFSPEAGASAPISNGENIGVGRLFPIALGSIGEIARADGLFVAASSSAAANVATSPDGETWTLRSMVSSKQWVLGVDGSDVLALPWSDTAAQISTDSGVTWTAGTATPASLQWRPPRSVGGVWLAFAGGTTAYRCASLGGAWTTETLPATPSGQIYVINGRFVLVNLATATAWYSTSGLTGSWTSVALPVTPAVAWGDASVDELYFTATGPSAQLYTAVDHATFAPVSDVFSPDGSKRMWEINGIWAQLSAAFGAAFTLHAGGPVMRVCPISPASGRAATDGARWLLWGGGSVLVITEATSQTAVFEAA